MLHPHNALTPLAPELLGLKRARSPTWLHRSLASLPRLTSLRCCPTNHHDRLAPKTWQKLFLGAKKHPNNADGGKGDDEDAEDDADFLKLAEEEKQKLEEVTFISFRNFVDKMQRVLAKERAEMDKELEELEKQSPIDDDDESGASTAEAEDKFDNDHDQHRRTTSHNNQDHRRSHTHNHNGPGQKEGGHGQHGHRESKQGRRSSTHNHDHGGPHRSKHHSRRSSKFEHGRRGSRFEHGRRGSRFEHGRRGSRFEHGRRGSRFEHGHDHGDASDSASESDDSVTPQRSLPDLAILKAYGSCASDNERLRQCFNIIVKASIDDAKKQSKKQQQRSEKDSDDSSDSESNADGSGGTDAGDGGESDGDGGENEVGVNSENSVAETASDRKRRSNAMPAAGKKGKVTTEEKKESTPTKPLPEPPVPVNAAAMSLLRVGKSEKLLLMLGEVGCNQIAPLLTTALWWRAFYKPLLENARAANSMGGTGDTSTTNASHGGGGAGSPTTRMGMQLIEGGAEEVDFDLFETSVHDELIRQGKARQALATVRDLELGKVFDIIEHGFKRRGQCCSARLVRGVLREIPAVLEIERKAAEAKQKMKEEPLNDKEEEEEEKKKKKKAEAAAREGKQDAADEWPPRPTKMWKLSHKERKLCQSIAAPSVLRYLRRTSHLAALIADDVGGEGSMDDGGDKDKTPVVPYHSHDTAWDTWVKWEPTPPPTPSLMLMEEEEGGERYDDPLNTSQQTSERHNSEAGAVGAATDGRSATFSATQKSSSPGPGAANKSTSKSQSRSNGNRGAPLSSIATQENNDVNPNDDRLCRAAFIGVVRLALWNDNGASVVLGVCNPEDPDPADELERALSPASLKLQSKKAAALKKKLARMQEAFNIIDDDGGGTLDTRELLDAIKDPKAVESMISACPALQSLLEPAVWFKCFMTMPMNEEGEVGERDGRERDAESGARRKDKKCGENDLCAM